MIKNVKINNKVDYFSIKALSNSELHQIQANPEWINYKDLEHKEEQYESDGTLIHYYILEPTKFTKKYKVFGGIKPSSRQQTGYASLVSTGTQPEDAYKVFYKTEGVSSNAISKAIKKLNNELKEYIEVKKEDRVIILINESTEKQLQEIKNSLINNKHTNKVLFELNGINESNFFGRYDKEKVKAKIDRIAISEEDKIIYLVDFKTMATKSHKTNITKDIKWRMKNYNYYQQLSFYSLFIKDYFKEKIKDGWKIEILIIFAIKNIPYSVRIYKIKNKHIKKAKNKLKKMLDNAILHKELGYSNSIEYYTNSSIPEI